MVNRSNASDIEMAETGSQESNNSNGDVQSYLISNYRDALKRGDKSAAKSCLLAARYFSVNDPNVTNEIYLMAKGDGDVSEASKCFTNIFNDLFANGSTQHKNNPSNELVTVVNQMKEELRHLVNELKSQHLKLKSNLAQGSTNIRQSPSINPSPILSPRIRMSSEDRAASRETLSKLDSHFHSTTKSYFYQQLFDNLADDVKRSLLNHSIETCDNPFERCRLMMLAISIFNETATYHGGRLFRLLIELSHPDKGKATVNPRPPNMCRYAKSLLVLDAIPLVFSITTLSAVDIDINELFEQTITFYAESCVENSVSEYEFNELHEGLKKTIAARILGKENISTPDDIIEDHAVAALYLLGEKFIESVSDPKSKSKFESLRASIAGRQVGAPTGILELSEELIDSLELKEDIPDEILFASKDDSSSQLTVTPPPKARGRPKKVQPSSTMSLDDGVKKHMQNKVREIHFVLHSVVQHFLVQCSSYFRHTRSRILLKIDNPLAIAIESELSKSTSQRTSRSKTSNQTNESYSSPSKKAKLDTQPPKIFPSLKLFEDSPLNSEQSKKMDQLILFKLKEAEKCFRFLESNPNWPLTKLWLKFKESNNFEELKWFLRFLAESSILEGHHDTAINVLSTLMNEEREELQVKKDPLDSETTTLTVMPASPIHVTHLRALTQLISCHVQLLDKVETYQKIDELLSSIKQSGLLTNDEGYLTGNTMDEYRVFIENEGNQKLGFLFFDALSMIRFCVDILITILKRHFVCPNALTDTIIGHTIVLSQFDWPKESSIYNQCITWIRANKPKSITPQCLSAATKFTYTEFFHYIINPNVIEDFMAMLNRGYTLDIKSAHVANNANNSSQRLSNSSQTSSGSASKNTTGGSSTRSGKAITTRGVNKSFKEDLKVALIAQMRGSCTLAPLDMISEFIQTSLIPILCPPKK